jgi:hypothetical protein
VGGSARSETKVESAHRVRPGDVAAPATLGSFAPIDRKRKNDGDKVEGLTAPYPSPFSLPSSF